MKKRIHVNQHKIRSNKKTGDREPVLTVKTYKSNDYCHEALIEGPCRVVYSPDKPLSCGAKVWIETESEVICHTCNTCNELGHTSQNCSHSYYNAIHYDDDLMKKVLNKFISESLLSLLMRFRFSSE